MGGSLRTPLRPLPSNLAPHGQRCIKFEIPDDDEWERAAYSALYAELAMWYVWQRDTAKSGAPVARLWRRALRSWRHCDNSISPILHGSEVEDFMPLRVDCDCRVFVTCCDGTEKELATVDMIGTPTQPGGGAVQPKPGGPPICYHATLNASSRYYVPTVVNSGDVITINNGAGAVSNSHNGQWHCFSGNQFFAGACVGFGFDNGADPVPTALNSTLVAEINGTFYSLESGTLTVPGGISNEPVTIQVNDAVIAGLAGQFTFDVCVQNNEAAAWCHHLDFRLATYGWVPNTFDDTPGAVWAAGVGWQGAPGTINPGNSYCDIKTAVSAFNLTGIRIVYENGAMGASIHDFISADGGATSFALDGGAGAHDTSFAMTLAGQTRIGIDLETAGGAAAPSTITDVYISGAGSDPFVAVPGC